jgi:hypothetical protein
MGDPKVKYAKGHLEELREMLVEAELDVQNLKQTIFEIEVSQAYATIYRAAYKLELTGDS